MGIPRSQLPPHIRSQIARQERAAHPDHQTRGRRARQGGDAFERVIEDTFRHYADQGVAWLRMMPVPTSPCGMRHMSGQPLRILSGTAPFDVYGWAHDGRFVGAELKSNAATKTRLPIVSEGTHSHGLQAHQLHALVLLSAANGYARIVWKNGTQVGVLPQQTLARVDRDWRSALAGEAGRKSIPWSYFVDVPFTASGGPDWLRLTQRKRR